jgi:hypothetical protein
VKVDAREIGGKTALDQAVGRGHTEVADLLREHSKARREGR